MLKKSVSMEQIKMFCNNQDEDDLIMTDNIEQSDDNNIYKYNMLIDSKALEDYSRNNRRNTNLNVLNDLDEGNSRNNFIPSFNQSFQSIHSTVKITS